MTRTGTKTKKKATTDEFQALLDACVDAVVIIDHHGVIQTFNASAERLFGYSAAQIIGQRVETLMPEPDRSQHAGYLSRFLKSGEAHVIGIGRDIIALRRDGSTFPANLAVGQIGGSGPPRFVGFLHDLTMRRRQEQELRAVGDAMRETQERLTHVARLSTLGELTTGLAHELNQPLTAITLYAQAAERLLRAAPADHEEVAAALQQIGSQALRAGAVIKRLRTLVKSRATQRERVAVNALVRELAVLTEADTRLNEVRVDLQLTDPLPDIEADPIQLQQVLINLVRNAIEALQGQSAATRRIEVRTGMDGPDHVAICVSDTGPGVPPDCVQRLFEAFFTTKPEGTGLGLAISRSLITDHGGQLTYQPNLPQGSVFQLSLPAHSGEDA
ncbi:MAG: PAS domain S-box protein [Steroidobacteraceae bacterium]